MEPPSFTSPRREKHRSSEDKEFPGDAAYGDEVQDEALAARSPRGSSTDNSFLSTSVPRLLVEERTFEVGEAVQVRVPGRHGWHPAVVTAAVLGAGDSACGYMYSVIRKAGAHNTEDTLVGLKAGNLRPPSTVDALSGGVSSPTRGGFTSSGGSSNALSRSGGALTSKGGGGESPAKGQDSAPLPLPESFDDALAAKGLRPPSLAAFGLGPTGLEPSGLGTAHSATLRNATQGAASATAATATAATATGEPTTVMSEPSSSISTHRSAVTRYHTRRSAPSSRHSAKSPSAARATATAARPSAWAADARPTGRQAPTPPPPGSTTAASNAPAEAHSSSSSSSSHHRHNGSKRYSAPAKHAEQPAWHRHRTDSHPPLPARGAAAPAAAPSASPQSLSSTSSSLAAAEAHLGQAVASASARADAGLLPAPLRALLRVASERGVDVLTWLAPEGGWPSSDSASTAGKHSSSSSSSVNGAIASPSIPPPVAQYVLSADVFKEKLTQLGLGLAVGRPMAEQMAIERALAADALEHAAMLLAASSRSSSLPPTNSNTSKAVASGRLGNKAAPSLAVDVRRLAAAAQVIATASPGAAARAVAHAANASPPPQQSSRRHDNSNSLRSSASSIQSLHSARSSSSSSSGSERLHESAASLPTSARGEAERAIHEDDAKASSSRSAVAASPLPTATTATTKSILLTPLPADSPDRRHRRSGASIHKGDGSSGLHSSSSSSSSSSASLVPPVPSQQKSSSSIGHGSGYWATIEASAERKLQDVCQRHGDKVAKLRAALGLDLLAAAESRAGAERTSASVHDPSKVGAAAAQVMSASKLRSSHNQSEVVSGTGTPYTNCSTTTNSSLPSSLVTVSALTSALWACELRWPPEVVQGIMRRAMTFAPISDGDEKGSAAAASKEFSRTESKENGNEEDEEGNENKGATRHASSGPLDPTLPPLTERDPTPMAVPATALRTYLLKLRLVKAGAPFSSSSSSSSPVSPEGVTAAHVVEPWSEWFGRKQAMVAAHHKQQLTTFASALRGATPVVAQGMPAEEAATRLREWRALVEQFERLPKGVAAAAVGLLSGHSSGGDNHGGGGSGGGEMEASAAATTEEEEEAANTQAAARYNALLGEEAMAEASAWVRGEGGRSARADVRARMVAAIEARRHQVASSSSSSTSAAPLGGEPDAVSLFQGYQRHVATWKRLKKGLSPLAGVGAPQPRPPTMPVATGKTGGVDGDNDDEEEYSEDGSGSLGVGGGGGAAAQDSFALSELGDQPPSFNQWLDTFADPQGKVKKACEREVVQAKAQRLLATEAAPLVGVPLSQAPRAYRGVGEAGRGPIPPSVDDHNHNNNSDDGNGDEEESGGLFGLGKSKHEDDEEEKGGNGAEVECDGGSLSAGSVSGSRADHRSSGQQQPRGRGGRRGGDTVWYRPLSLTKNLLKQWLEDACKGKRDSDGGFLAWLEARSEKRQETKATVGSWAKQKAQAAAMKASVGAASAVLCMDAGGLTAGAKGAARTLEEHLRSLVHYQDLSEGGGGGDRDGKRGSFQVRRASRAGIALHHLVKELASQPEAHEIAPDDESVRVAAEAERRLRVGLTDLLRGPAAQGAIDVAKRVLVACMRFVASDNRSQRHTWTSSSEAAAAHAPVMFKALFGPSSSSSTNRRSTSSGRSRSYNIGASTSSSSASLAPNRIVEVQLRPWGKWHRAEVLRVAPDDLPPTATSTTTAAAAAGSPDGDVSSPLDDVISPKSGDVSRRYDGSTVAAALFPGSPTLSPSNQPKQESNEETESGLHNVGESGNQDDVNENDGPVDENDSAKPLPATARARAKDTGGGPRPAFSRTAARVSARKAAKNRAASAQWYDVRFLPESRTLRAGEAVESAVRRCRGSRCLLQGGMRGGDDGEAAVEGLQAQHAVLDEFGDRFMEDVSGLKQLPWIGPKPASGFAAASNATGRRTHAFVVPKVAVDRVLEPTLTSLLADPSVARDVRALLLANGTKIPQPRGVSPDCLRASLQQHLAERTDGLFQADEARQVEVARQLARDRDQQADRAFEEWARNKDAEKQRARATELQAQQAAKRAAQQSRALKKKAGGGTFKKWCAAVDQGLYVSRKDGSTRKRPSSLSSENASGNRGSSQGRKAKPAWNFELPSAGASGLFDKSI